MTRHLISYIETIDQLRESFKLLERDNINWTETYIDNTTGKKWLYYRVDSYLQGNGYPIFGLLPLPDTKELINLPLFSEKDDEVFAACRTLIDNEEIKKVDFRAELIEQLENIKDIQRQKKIIEFTGLDKMLNRRQILGKSFDEVNTDANYYKSIADRADKLKRQ